MCVKETYSRVRIVKYLSDNFPIQNGLKQGDVLPQLITNVALDYVIRNVQKLQMGLKLNGAHQLQVYTDDVDLLGDNTEVNADRTKCHYMNVGKNHDIATAYRTFENVAQFRCLGTTVTNQNLIQEEIKRRANSGNDCHHSVFFFLVCCLKN
jgi:hypothetical protein